MSTNHTPNYNLSQWEADDQVLRTEFNEDNAKLDAALAEQAAALEAETSARTSECGALNSVLAKKGTCTVETFTYSGTGSQPTSINFPRKPTAFIVTGFGGILIGSGARDTVYSQNGWMGSGTWSGSRFIGTSLQGDIHQQMNTSGYTFVVTAFYTES